MIPHLPHLPHLFYSTTFRRFAAISLSFNCTRSLILNKREISDEHLKRNQTFEEFLGAAYGENLSVLLRNVF